MPTHAQVPFFSQFDLISIILVGSHQKSFNFYLGLQEPLRVALLSHLRSLVQNLISNSETTEQIIQILVNDNLDLGCALTETVATRKVALWHSLILFMLLGEKNADILSVVLYNKFYFWLLVTSIL